MRLNTNLLKPSCKPCTVGYLTGQHKVRLTLGGAPSELISLSPFSAFPEDDRLEYELIATIRKHEQAQGKVNAESRAAELLARAGQALSVSHQSGVQASGYSTYGTKILSYPRNLQLTKTRRFRPLGWWKVGLILAISIVALRAGLAASQM